MEQISKRSPGLFLPAFHHSSGCVRRAEALPKSEASNDTHSADERARRILWIDEYAARVNARPREAGRGLFRSRRCAGELEAVGSTDR
jgi:hypothetical protein